MNTGKMQIEKIDVVLICGCALAGFVFVLLASGGNVAASLIGIPSGAGGGTVASIFRRVIRLNANKHT
jgi:hypothetical protein